MHDVVITGMGQISALGHSVDDAVAAAWAGHSAVRRCDDVLMGEDGAELRCRVAATVEGFEPERWMPPKTHAWHDIATAYALAATAEALDDAGLAAGDVESERAAVVLGTAAPGNRLYHKVFDAALRGDGPQALPGRMLPQLSATAATAMVAMRYRFTAATFALVNACASGATAMAVAADLIRAGRADVVIAGGTDAPIGLTIFGSMINARAMNPTSDPHRACRPFSADRAGLVVGEGAAIVVLESAAHARARGARVLGRMLGEAMTNDAYHMYSPEPTGGSWARTVTAALQRADATAEDVDAVSAHAASTPLGDATETRALRQALGLRAYEVPVSATKSMHGHTFGAAGAIETVLALAAMRKGWVLPTANLDEPDPECDLDYVPDAGRLGAGRTLLKTSFGFGGTNTCLLLAAA